MDGHVHAHNQPAFPVNAPDAAAPLLLVDGHNLLWGATFGFPAAIYSRDKTRTLTGTFAFHALLRVAVRDNLASSPEIIVVFDGENGGASRKADHDGYKASRPRDDAASEPLTYLPDVKRGLDAAGVEWVEHDRHEADDVIASLTAAALNDHPQRQVVILSRDRDFYQLVDDRVSVLNTRFRPGQRFVTPSQVHRRHSVHPDQWTDFRALSGDPADEIPGVRGIGAKTAAQLLEGGLHLEDLPESGRLASGRAANVAKEFDLALKWRDLIRLDTAITTKRPTGQASPPLPTPADLLEELGLW